MLARLPPPGGRNKPAILSAAATRMCFMFFIFVFVVSELRCVFVSALPTDGECTSSVHYPPALIRSPKSVHYRNLCSSTTCTCTYVVGIFYNVIIYYVVLSATT